MIEFHFCCGMPLPFSGFVPLNFKHSLIPPSGCGLADEGIINYVWGNVSLSGVPGLENDINSIEILSYFNVLMWGTIREEYDHVGLRPESFQELWQDFFPGQERKLVTWRGGKGLAGKTYDGYMKVACFFGGKGFKEGRVSTCCSEIC